MRDAIRPAEDECGNTNKPDSHNRGTVKLCDVLREFVDKQVFNRQGYMEAIAQVCSQVLPGDIFEHCRIDGIVGKRLKILVDSPAYIYQLQIHSSQVLNELHIQFPRIPVEKIKFILA